jgi:nicotinamide riboside kinase
MMRIAVTGPESTGKSSMVKQLAKHYGGSFVPEFSQIELNDALPSNSNFIFYDTDLLVCRIWMEVVFGACPDWLIAESRKQRYSHTLLMNIDIPWEPDPLREHPHLREELFTRYRTALTEDQRTFTIVSGINEERFENAKSAINHLFKNKLNGL